MPVSSPDCLLSVSAPLTVYCRLFTVVGYYPRECDPRSWLSSFGLSDVVNHGGVSSDVYAPAVPSTYRLCIIGPWAAPPSPLSLC